MPLSSRLGFGLALSLVVGLGTPVVVPAISDNVYTKNSFASSLAQTQTAQAQTQPTAFSDVPADYWAHDYIAGLAKSNIISGFGDGTFKPNEAVTRAQFAAILRQAFLTSQPTTAQAFKDVPAGYWATDAVASARSAGFLSGYPDNTFKPNNRILRVQALVSLANGLKYPAGNFQFLSNYKDTDTVPAYARPSTAAAAQANLVVSYPSPDQILPNRAASRAEVAAFVYQALVKAGRVAPIAVKPEGRWQAVPTATIATETYQVRLSQDGQRLAAIANDNKNIQVWNTQTNTLLLTVPADEPNGAFSTVAMSKDGTQVAAIMLLPTSGKRLVVRAVADGKVLLSTPLNSAQTPPPQKGYITQPYPTGIEFSSDGKQVITQLALGTKPTSEPFGTTIYNSLSFHDIKTGKVTQAIDLLGVDDKIPLRYMVSPDGSLLASLSADFSDITVSDLGIVTRINIWQRNKDNRFSYLTTLPIAKDGIAVFDAVFTTSNQLNLITTSSLSKLLANPMAEEFPQTRLETWNPQTAERFSSTVLPAERCVRPYVTTLSPDGTGYYSSYPDDGTCLGNIKTGEFLKLPDQPFAYNIVGFSGDGNSLAISNIANSSGPNVQIFSKSKN